MRPRKHKGLATYRLATNPVERVFARRWAELHRNEGRGPLDYMLAPDNRPAGEVTDRDAAVAATVVQWLGSPVGLAWLRETLIAVERAERRARKEG